MLRPWRGGAGRLRVLQPVNTEYVIVFQGWRATSGRVRRAISLRNAPTGNPVHPPNHGGNVTGTCGRGRRPGGPPPARDVRQSDLVRGAGRARGTRAPTNVGGLMHQGQRVGGGRGRRGYGRDKRGPPAWHRAISLRNARVPAPRHEAPQDEISPRNNLESRRAARRVRHVRPSPGLPRRPGRGEKRMRSRFLPIACLSRSTFPCEARAAGDTAIPLENRDKIRKKVNVPFLCRPGRKLRRTHYSRQKVWKCALRYIASAFICFLLLLCMDSPQQLHCRECLSSQHCLLRLRHYLRS